LKQYSNCIGPQSLGGGGSVVLDGVVTIDVVTGSGVVRAAVLSEINKTTLSILVIMYRNIVM
jgi:hypothetical protein